MNVWRRRTSEWSRASARACSSVGAISSLVASAATAIQLLVGVGERESTRRHEDREVIQDVRRLLAKALVGLAGGGAGHLVGLLSHLLADARRVRDQLRRVAPLGPLVAAARHGTLERRQGL